MQPRDEGAQSTINFIEAVRMSYEEEGYLGGKTSLGF